MGIKYKKRIRLKHFDYKGFYRYFITMCTSNKSPLFVDHELVLWLVKILKEKSETYGFKVWVYCFMPDHLHLLIEGIGEQSCFKKFISNYKQITGYYFKQNRSVSLWQINYFEHVLRHDDATDNIISYILDNPVRKGLVRDFRDYPFSGSFEIDIQEFV